MNTELEQLKGKIFGDSEEVFLVTTGSGRRKVAHIPSPSPSQHVLCNSMKKDNLKRVDSATVERFYTVCKDCSKLAENR